MDNSLKIEYFYEQEWSNFATEQTILGAIKNLPQDKNEEMLGMPLFAEEKFAGIIQEKGSVLGGQEILKFICKIHQTTSILDFYLDEKEYCQ